MHHNVLIIDDEAELASATKEYFEAFDVSADVAKCAAEALAWLKSNTADLILLDINLKNESGFELCKTLRREFNMPILFISARLSRDDILLALNIGGDDYITKPYELSILLAKVKARLARARQINNKVIKAGDLTIDLELRRAYKNGAEVELKNKEFLLLGYLLQHKNKPLSKDEIFSAVWGDGFFSDGTLTVHIRRLREKIEKDPENPEFIKTVWGVGYEFNEE
ncbi:MAG: response regulator transcription factor [Firmicutes bacterium]|nr:response regulator transcription factor [Bacillota bacterium]